MTGRPMADLSDALLDEIQHDLEGTCRNLETIIEEYELDMDVDILEDRLLDGAHPVERSKCCEWWFAVVDLEFDEDRNGGVCEQCEPAAFDL